MTGMRPVVELMYVDFTGIAMDQINNQAAKIRYMFGGKVTVPLVIRTQGGTGKQIAAQHSSSLEAWFMHVPGLKTVMPSTPYDAKGLLLSAIRDDNPVMFIEHKAIYGEKGPCPEEDFTVPIGKAARAERGNRRHHRELVAHGDPLAGGGRDARLRGDLVRGHRSAEHLAVGQGGRGGISCEDEPVDSC